MACNGDSTTLAKQWSDFAGTITATQLPGGTPTGSGAVVMATSPVLTTPTLQASPATSDNSLLIASTAYVKAQGYLTPATDAVTSVFTRTGAIVATSGDYSVAQITGAAPLASPALTGVPTAPTAAVNTNTTQLATTAFVIGQGYATLASPTFTGTPAAPTASAGTNTTQLATTAFTNTIFAAPPAVGSTTPNTVSTTGLNVGSAKTVFNTSGLATKYNNLTCAGQGLSPTLFQTASATLTANFNAGAAQTIVTPTVAGSVYTISAWQSINRAATTSATMPSLTVGWTENGGIARTFTLIASNSTNSTATQASGTVTIYTNGSTAVTITSAGYASSGATTMQYSLAVVCEQLV